MSIEQLDKKPSIIAAGFGYKISITFIQRTARKREPLLTAPPSSYSHFLKASLLGGFCMLLYSYFSKGAV